MKPKASVIYSGPSKIDGSPIVCIYVPKSSNSKTGASMAQTYILRADIDPITASRTGADFAVCGNCRHRGQVDPSKTTGWSSNRSCYVNLIHAPGQVFKAYKAGKYRTLMDLESIKDLGQDQVIRLGSYGDPMALPSHIIRALLSKAKGHTGYTHQADTLPDDNHSSMMISADTAEQAQSLHNQGKRTFRVIPLQVWKDKGEESILPNEILCPASKEAGQRVTCSDCLLCSGQHTKAKSICIPAHGSGAKHA